MRQLARLSKIKLMTIGNKLKQAREKKHVSIDEAYQYTRILPEILSAFERDDFPRISSPIYIKSFLRKYSSYLQLNPESILSEYKRMDIHQSLSEPEPTIVDEKPPARRIDTQKLVKVVKAAFKPVLIILLLILLIKATGWTKHKFLIWRSAHLNQAKQEKKTNQANQAKQSKPSKLLEPLREKKASPAVKEAKRPVKEPLKGVLIPQNERLNLSISTTDDVWIELRMDGNIIFKNVLKKGSEENWQADKNFELWTGNAAAMNITLNGNNLGSPGVGVKKGIIINRQGIKK